MTYSLGMVLDKVQGRRGPYQDFKGTVGREPLVSVKRYLHNTCFHKKQDLCEVQKVYWGSVFNALELSEWAHCASVIIVLVRHRSQDRQLRFSVRLSSSDANPTWR